MKIYKTTNLINGKIYIGQSNERRAYYKGGGKLLKFAFKKYGRQNFKVETIVSGNFNQLLLDELEIHYIRLYNSTNHKSGYNLESGGMGGRTKQLSEQHKLNISLSNKGRKKPPRTEEHCKNISLSQKGKKGYSPTEESLRKFREKMCGRPFTKEHIQAIREVQVKNRVNVYKDNVLIKSYLGYRECAKNLKVSINTIKAFQNTERLHKNYKFEVIKINQILKKDRNKK